MQELKQCKVCGEHKSLEKYELIKPKGKKSYRISTCMQCRSKIVQERKNKLSLNIEIIIDRRYKEIKAERILNIEELGIAPVCIDETFVKLMDCEDTWMSNNGRVIKKIHGKYKLCKGSLDSSGSLRYRVKKNVYLNGKWIFKNEDIYVAKTVVQEFIVNPDVKNNIYIWHRGFNKEDNYYKNLYPLNQEQYRIVKAHYLETGDDSEEFIINVMNDIKFKPGNWSRKSMKPVVEGIGYHGRIDVDCKSEAYLRWSDMLHRCYNEKLHERYPQYSNCRICEEWLNFSNFEVYYENNKPKDKKVDLDKDILFKRNSIYSPETVCFVPHVINTLFVNGKKSRGDLPLGVWLGTNKGKYRAGMNFLGKQIKLGTFDTVEAAFARYKEYKEDFIKDMAEQYKEEIPQKVYNAMMNWKVEITD